MKFPGEHFSRENGSLRLGGLLLQDIAKQYGTPLYVYDLDRIRTRCEQIAGNLKKITPKSRAFFAVKALGNLSILKLIHQSGLGMDVVSGGEIERCLAAGVVANDIVFSGVAKTRAEVELGVKVAISCFNIESPHEVDLLMDVTKSHPKKIKVALRINPDVDGLTHKKINTGPADTKFGLNPNLAMELSKKILSCQTLELSGLSCHIGSQILDLSSFRAAAAQVRDFAEELIKWKAPIQHIDMGGGLGVAYKPTDLEKVPSFEDWISVSKLARPHDAIDLHLEPGRSIVADSGVLLTTVLDIKQTESKTFALVDAGMTELVRPAMYDAYHHIEPILAKNGYETARFDVVGPVCETSCWLAENALLGHIARGDVLAVMHAGAYGMSMASHYNTRPKPAEVGIENQTTRLIRKRETTCSLWQAEEL